MWALFISFLCRAWLLGTELAETISISLAFVIGLDPRAPLRYSYFRMSFHTISPRAHECGVTLSLCGHIAVLRSVQYSVQYGRRSEAAVTVEVCSLSSVSYLAPLLDNLE